MKGESGRHLTTNPSLGYVKDEQDKDKRLRFTTRPLGSSTSLTTSVKPGTAGGSGVKNRKRPNKNPPAEPGVFPMRVKPYDTSHASRRVGTI